MKQNFEYELLAKLVEKGVDRDLSNEENQYYLNLAKQFIKVVRLLNKLPIQHTSVQQAVKEYRKACKDNQYWLMALTKIFPLTSQI